MFNALVGSIALYGTEVWGWRNENRVDKIKRKYEKWILGLDIRTPNYILAEEIKTKELKLEAVKRAVKYEEKTKQLKNSDSMHKRDGGRKKRQRRK